MCEKTFVLLMKHSSTLEGVPTNPLLPHSQTVDTGSYLASSSTGFCHPVLILSLISPPVSEGAVRCCGWCGRWWSTPCVDAGGGCPGLSASSCCSPLEDCCSSLNRRIFQRWSSSCTHQVSLPSPPEGRAHTLGFWPLEVFCSWSSLPLNWRVYHPAGLELGLSGL